MQLVSLYDNEKVSDIVRTDYRTADVFKEYGINYCCAGNLPLREVCLQKNIAHEELVTKLNQASQAINLPVDLQFHKWKTDFLVDYIVNVHHAYLRQAMPQLGRDLEHFLQHHRNKYPYFEDMVTIYSAIHILMTSEYEEQEEILFPYIKQINSAYQRKEPYGGLFVRTLRKPMNRTRDDIKKLEEHLTSLRQITGNYRVQEKACTGYNILMKRLNELDNQLVLHKHIENNILFPATTAMEQELLKT